MFNICVVVCRLDILFGVPTVYADSGFGWSKARSQCVLLRADTRTIYWGAAFIHSQISRTFKFPICSALWVDGRVLTRNPSHSKRAHWHVVKPTVIETLMQGSNTQVTRQGFPPKTPSAWYTTDTSRLSYGLQRGYYCIIIYQTRCLINTILIWIFFMFYSESMLRYLLAHTTY